MDFKNFSAWFFNTLNQDGGVAIGRTAVLEGQMDFKNYSAWFVNNRNWDGGL